MSSQDPNLNKIFFQKYLCQRKIGKGSFGTVYSGVNTVTNEKVAIKMEKKFKNNNGTLETEAYRLIYLQGEGIPKIYCYGNNQSNNILIQELLGRSLEDIFNSMHKKFSLKTVCVLGIEMMKRIRHVHSLHHIHRDIKPDNFMTGRDENENKIYIIDFGLAKKYYSTSKHQHIKFCKGKSLIGTARYCGRNAHRGYEQSRRDDMESIGYVLMYFLLGVLPWQGLRAKQGEDQFEKIAEKKYNTPFEDLCRNQPNEFLLYFKHVDGLAFEEEPDYEYLIGLFQEIINKNCNDCYYDFDWKKGYCTHLSAEQEMNQHNTTINARSRDVSLIVNKNGTSMLNESQGGIEKEDIDEDEGNKSNIIYAVNEKTKKKKRKNLSIPKMKDFPESNDEVNGRNKTLNKFGSGVLENKNKLSNNEEENIKKSSTLKKMKKKIESPRKREEEQTDNMFTQKRNSVYENSKKKTSNGNGSTNQNSITDGRSSKKIGRSTSQKNISNTSFARVQSNNNDKRIKRDGKEDEIQPSDINLNVSSRKRGSVVSPTKVKSESENEKGKSKIKRRKSDPLKDSTKCACIIY